MFSGGKYFSLISSGIDAAKLKSWGVIQQDMAHLVTGYEAKGTTIGEAMSKADKILPIARSIQTGALTIGGFKLSESKVRTLSALTAHAMAIDAIEAMKHGTDPRLVREFKGLADGMRNVNTKKLLEGDQEQMVNFIARFVTDNQGGYTPNQLPWWVTTPMGRFMGKFMPYGIQMNQLHIKNLRRRAKDKGASLGVSFADMAVMMGAFTLGGEMFSWLMELLFGKQRGVASYSEIYNAPADKKMSKALDRMYDSMLYTGGLGAIMEVAQAAAGLVSTDLRRTKKLTEPAGIAVMHNFRDVVQNAYNSNDLDASKMINDFLTDQVSLYRDAKNVAFKTADAAGIEWEDAILDKRLKQRRRLLAIANRYGDDTGMDTPTVMMGGRFLPNEMTPYYQEVKDALYLGNVRDAKAAAMKVAENTSNRERAWANTSGSIRGSQPMKIGRYTATEYQEEFMRWAKRNLSKSEFDDIMEVHSVYIETAEKAGLLGTGNPQAVREMKTRMNKKSPSRRRGTTTDPFQRRRNLLREKAGF